MPDLAPARSAQWARLAHRVGREVVVVHEPLEFLSRQAIQLLLVGHRAEGGDRQRLRLPASEKAGAVRPRQHPDLDGDSAYVLQATAVDTDALVHDALPHAVLDRVVVELAEDVDVLRETLAELDDGLATKVVEGALARRLVRAVKHLVEAQREVLANDLEHLLRVRVRDPLALFETHLLLQGELRGADLFDRVVRGRKRVEHDLLAHALGARFDHQDRIRRPGDDKVEVGVAHLRHRWVDHDLAVDVTHAYRANRTLERDVGG